LSINLIEYANKGQINRAAINHDIQAIIY
jgi:hypothetical protein